MSTIDNQSQRNLNGNSHFFRPPDHMNALSILDYRPRIDLTTGIHPYSSPDIGTRLKIKAFHFSNQ